MSNTIWPSGLGDGGSPRPRNGDRQRIALGSPELDDVGAVVLRAVDHDAVLVVVVIAIVLTAANRVTETVGATPFLRRAS